MTRKRKSFSKKLPQRYLQGAILQLLSKNPQKKYAASLITRKLKTKNSKSSVQAALDTLLDSRLLNMDRKGKYSIGRKYSDDNGRESVKRRIGTIDMIQSGGAYVIVKGEEKDIYVPKRHMGGAMNRDEVEISILPAFAGRKPEGRIIDIIKRYRTSFLGVFRDFKKYGYVFVEDKYHSFEVRVIPRDYGDANDGDIVVVAVDDFGQNKRGQFLGRIVNILQADSRNEFQMNSLLINNGFNLTFSEQVLEETHQLSEDIPSDEENRRLDLRDIMTLTIDPVDAKDFDDAISLRKLDNGNFEIGVHIADVSHFVKKGTLLDKEAYDRATSVYLVDRVCPMLPEHLSNKLCSLRPNEDKLTYSILFEIDEKANIKKEWIGKTIIHSNKRFTYEEVQEILDEDQGELASELKLLNQFAQLLRDDRFKKGSIDFESDEVRILVDDQGHPLELYRKERLDAHKLVEEFMLLANKRIAHFITQKMERRKGAGVYRVHDLPDGDRLMELALLASEFNIKLNFDTPASTTRSLNSLKDSVSDEDLLRILRPMAIRCMAKAAYSTDNIGHYGLGFSHYTHFTSPIRRYSDVLVHRILDDVLFADGKIGPDNLEDQCRHISNKERSAIDAERESIRIKQIEYLMDHIGEEFKGMLRGIIDKGFFIELAETLADGFVRFDKMNESFTIHPARIKMKGARSGMILRIGDPVLVRLEAVDLERLQIEFSFLQKIDS